jgi:hypothetical protein
MFDDPTVVEVHLIGPPGGVGPPGLPGYYVPAPFDPDDWTTTLQAAIAAASAGTRPAVVDMRHVHDTIHVTGDLFQGATDVTLLVGRNRWEFDTDTCQQTPYHGCSIIMDGATWTPDVDNPDGAPSLGTLGYGLITPAVMRTTAALTVGSADIVVADVSNIRLGCALGVMGLSGTSQHQKAVLSGNITSSVTTIPVASTTGFDAADYSNGVVLIGSEYVSYTGLTATTFTGCTRGAFGTIAASHTSGDAIYMTLYEAARVEAIIGTTVTVDVVSAVSLTGVTVLIGAHGVSILGEGVFDGRRGDDPNPSKPLLGAIYAALTGNLHIGSGFTFGRWTTGGIVCQGTIGTLLEPCVYFDNIRPVNGTGQDVFLFGPNRDGIFATRSHFDTRVAMFLDDRSAGGGDSIIGQNKRLNVTVGPAVTSSTTISFCATDSVLEAPSITSEEIGVVLGVSSTQWNNGAIATTDNIINIGRVNAGSYAVRIGDGTAGIPGLENAHNVIWIRSRVGDIPYRPVGNMVWIVDESVQVNTQHGVEVRNGDSATFMDFEFPDLVSALGAIRFFRSTATVSSPLFQIYAGDGTGAFDASISAKGGHSLFCVQGGRMHVGSATTPDYKLHVEGSFGFMPPASVSPANNGDMTFQLTSNTSLVIKVRGSDGVIRSNTLTLA